MAENVYKLILMTQNSYREVELTPEVENGFRIGTGRNCGVRYRKEQFFEDFFLEFSRNGKGWQLRCSDNIHVTRDGVLKQQSLELSHGLNFQVYSPSDLLLFQCSFLLDFERIHRAYRREIDLSGLEHVTIGGGGEHILLRDELVGGDTLSLDKKGNSWVLADHRSRYGVTHNGALIAGPVPLQDYDFFSIVGYSYFIKGNLLYTDPSPNCEISLPFTDRNESQSQLIYPKFNRSTRVQYQLPTDEVEILQPPPKPQPQRKNLLFSLIPSLFMLLMIIVLRGVMGGGGTFVIYSVCSMGIGIVMSVVTYISSGRQYRKDVARREARYRAYIGEKQEEIEVLRQNELRILDLIHSDLNESLGEVDAFGRRIFEKSGGDQDFLQVRLGTGPAWAQCKVTYTKQDFVDPEDPISTLPQQTEGKYRYLPAAPIVAHLQTSDGIGLVGPRAGLYEMLKNITLDLAIRHFYHEVKLCYLLDEEEAGRFEWLRWLQHLSNESLNVRNLICDGESRNLLLEFLYSELSRREARYQEKKDTVFAVHYVVFVADGKGIAKHPLSKYIESCHNLGFTFLFFAEYEELLPRGCTELVRLAPAGEEGAVLESGNGDQVFRFRYPAISDQAAERAALRLASIYMDEVSLEGSLTKNIDLFGLLDILGVVDLDLGKRWATSKVYESMAAPLGVRRKNEIVYLDISDKASAHGPHGLVAGTTGSGKSEILQSYVLSMATLFHPYDVGFVIIDFKGGGMANQFRNLPHLMGTITNIDGREIDRSLQAIKAELVRRQALFSQSGVNHINDYIKLYKKGAVAQPLPHLIMIVDEFAELKAEYPDFMKEMISAARIGRTLGVHLILATQKPSGVVDNQIWSNSKFKLCLKVQTKEDSNEVLHTPLAAEIMEPGRAYLQVGNNEIFELFQSAYSGAAVPEDGGERDVPRDIYELNLWGKRRLVYTNGTAKQKHSEKNQLQALVAYLDDYCQTQHIAHLAGICLPPLADTIPVSTLAREEHAFAQGIAIPVGVYDDPEQQHQGSLLLHLSEDNVFLVGSAQSGKTTFLQTLLYQAIDLYTPAQISFYIIDCGTMALKVFEQSCHVGGVVLPAEEERLMNLFKMFRNLTQRRKAAFSARGLGTYRAYLEAGFTDLPQIVLMIDNVAAFREYHPELDDELLALSREGQSVGICLVVTAAQNNAISYKMSANFGVRLAYHCNDAGEYSTLFDRCRIQPKEVPGRGLCTQDRRTVEFQTALCVAGEKEIARVEHLRTFLAENAARYPVDRAAPIPEVPALIRRTDLLRDRKELYAQPYRIPIGISYSTVDYQFLDLTTAGMFAISGRDRSGKTNFVQYILSCIQGNIFQNMTEAYILDSTNMQLEQAGQAGFVKQYTVDVGDTAALLETLYSKLEERHALTAGHQGEDRAQLLAGLPLLLLVVDHPGFFEEVSKDKELQKQFNGILKVFKGLKSLVIFSNVENMQLPFSAPESLKQVKEHKKLFFFDDVANLKLMDISVQQQRENKKPLGLGDGYQIFGGELQKLKTILDQ